MIKVPEQYQESFKILANLEPEVAQKYIDALKVVRIGSSVKDITIAVSLATGLSLQDSRATIEALASFFGVVEQTNKPTELIEGLAKSLVEEEVVASYADLSGFISTVTSALSFKQLFRLLTKARELASEYDKLFVSARVLTDFRPAFDEELKDEELSGLVVHQLRILYHTSITDHHEFFVTLDSSDLQNLKEALLRAEKKDAMLKKVMESKKIDILTVDGIHQTVSE